MNSHAYPNTMSPYGTGETDHLKSLALTSEILLLFSVFLFVLKYRPGRPFSGIYLWT